MNAGVTYLGEGLLCKPALLLPELVHIHIHRDLSHTYIYTYKLFEVLMLIGIEALVCVWTSD